MEGTFDKNRDQLLFDSERRSVGPGLYRLEEAQKNNKIALPWDNLTSNIDLSSTFLENNIRVDAESDLKNLGRKLSNNPKEKYIPDEVKEINPDMNVFNNIKEMYFHSENSRLNEPAFELKGMAKNRFISLKKNPQDNVIEPFKREGDNTYLDLIDTHEPCPVNLIN
tara:strand:- start:258 stop:758 length:501 start_codon:yes stop_codon:yes gene_type:complete